ncbi:SubName: Full=Uncharacterized protein {ECO:0000313/EMBL:CCA75413.1} [Serendipita indica DSM 11827]|nr:SubName: Full=Uncharacterized protein {ECO:0000313/EMBL:CCA75413.1} [Serendipita indica DSM 11827]
MSKPSQIEHQSIRITAAGHGSVNERVLQPRNIKEEAPGFSFNDNQDISDMNAEPRHDEPARFLDNSSFLVIAPSRQEIEEAKVAIDSQVALCVSLKEERDTRQRELVELEERIQAEEAILVNRRAKISVARRVPLEILSMIITAYVEDNAGSALVAMLVSRAWHQATLLAREIWSSISIITPDDDTSSDGSDQEVETFRQCASEPHLRYMLKMADRFPLKLRIICNEGHFASDLGPSGEHDCQVHRLLELFNKISKKPRIRSIEIQECHLAHNTFDTWDFSPLITLSVFGDHRRLLERIGKEALNLDTVDVSGENFMSFKRPASLLRLNRLTLRGSVQPLAQQHLVTFGSITTLSLERTKFHGPTRILLSQLQNLTLDHVSPFWPLDCPNLTKLTIKSEEGCDYDEVLQLPRLKGLICVDAVKPLFLRNFEAPSLDILEIATGCNKGTTYELLNLIWPTKAGSNLKRTPIEDLRQKLDPKILKIHYFSANHKDAARIFGRLTRCVHLHLINPYGISTDLFESISPKSRGRICLPDLKVFVIRSYGGKLEPFVEAAKAFLKRRREAGAPLTRFAFLHDDELRLPSGQRVRSLVITDDK